MAVSPQNPAPDSSQEKNSWSVQRIVTLTGGFLGGAIILLFVAGLLLALSGNAEVTAPRVQIIRDVVIIMMGLEFILIILALAVLILQIARLINLLQNEIKPILENTQETVNTAKSTVDFVSSNITQPIVRVSGFLAGTRVLIRELGGIRRAIRHENGREKTDDPQ